MTVRFSEKLIGHKKVTSYVSTIFFSRHFSLRQEVYLASHGQETHAGVRVVSVILGRY
jgi:hypothetical protein